MPELVHHKPLVNGSRLHLVGPGSGEPVLLLPGRPQDRYARHGGPLLAAQGRRVVVLDLRGMGNSDTPHAGPGPPITYPRRSSPSWRRAASVTC